MENVIIIGAGAAGLSAALELARQDRTSVLVSDMPSERAQSVMAEGGINAAISSEVDSPKLHAEETLRAGRYLADPKAVEYMAKQAPGIIERLWNAGMSFTLNKEGKPEVRAFGGQSVKRTFYAASNTGKQLMHTLIDQVRSYEVKGLVQRLTGWQFVKLLHKENQAMGCIVVNCFTGEQKMLLGSVILASGGLNGMFEYASGSVRNTGLVSASVFAEGVKFANGEFIQYHPTTAKLHGKNMLITEAVRGEGGRLYVMENGQPFYFMEEKYPELGNLMPRDVVSREEWIWMQKGKQVYLDMQHLDNRIYNTKLAGVLKDCRQFLSIDPTREPIPVQPGIHYFMGGIKVNQYHRTSMGGLYAAGECACQYHGANRLGGNSLLGALCGGRIAAQAAIEDKHHSSWDKDVTPLLEIRSDRKSGGSYVDGMKRMRHILQEGLGIVREENTLQRSVEELDGLLAETEEYYDETATLVENFTLEKCCFLGKAVLLSALARKESRGAHNRSDFPKESDNYEKITVAQCTGKEIQIAFERVGVECGY